MTAPLPTTPDPFPNNDGSVAFTPGPWADQSGEHGNSRKIHAAAHMGMPLATVSSYWTGTGPRDDERDANARLIAAAPELFQALEWAVNEFDGSTRYTSASQLQSCIEKCRAALAKATGA